MKKATLIIINLFLLLTFIMVLEIYAYKSIFVSNKLEFPDYKKFLKLEKEYIVDNHFYTNYADPTTLNQLLFENDGRSAVGGNYLKGNSILLLGCSYTYGLGLLKEQTFGYQLSEYAKIPVYNWGWKTEGPEYSLMELKLKDNILKLAKNPPKYVIYTYMYDHPRRILNEHRQYRWYFLRKFGLLSEQKFSIFDNIYLILAIKNKIFQQYMLSGNIEDKIFDYNASILREMKKEVLKNFPNSKFVVLLYIDSPENTKLSGKEMSSTEYSILHSSRWKELQKDGFIVVSTEDLTGRMMNKQEDLLQNDLTLTPHPTESAWKEIIPPLSKKLEI